MGGVRSRLAGGGGRWRGGAALKAQRATEAQEPPGTELGALPDATADTAAAKSQEAAMKDLAVDESLSEEARDSARKALEVLVSSQLLDMEQAAALKKRASAWKELESEAEFVHQQARIEALAATRKLEAEAQSKRENVDAQKKLQEMPEWLSEEMVAWLGQHRLQSCATDIARIAGA